MLVTMTMALAADSPPTNASNDNHDGPSEKVMPSTK